MAIIARWRMPPLNWWGYSSTRRSGSDMPTSRSKLTASARASRSETRRCCWIASIIWLPIV